MERFAEANFSRINNKNGFLMVRDPASVLLPRDLMLKHSVVIRVFSHVLMLHSLVQGIIRRVQEDGPDRGNVDLDILPRSVRYKLRDIMDDVRTRLFGISVHFFALL